HIEPPAVGLRFGSRELRRVARGASEAFRLRVVERRPRGECSDGGWLWEHRAAFKERELPGAVDLHRRAAGSVCAGRCVFLPVAKTQNPRAICLELEINFRSPVRVMSNRSGHARAGFWI